ncbi:MAG: TIGR03086 family metal-binding protein [Actinomycetes bacterium]
MTPDQPAATEPQPSPDNLASALQVTEGVVAGVRPEQAHLPTPCPEYDVSRLLDHLVGFATSFADKANGVEPAADPTATTAGDDPKAAYHDAAVRLIDGYRGGASDEATPLAVVLMETVTHGWDLARATGQTTRYPEEAVEAAIVAGRGMMSPRYRGEGMPFGEEVEASSSAPALDRLVAFMGRDPDWSA